MSQKFISDFEKDAKSYGFSYEIIPTKLTIETNMQKELFCNIIDEVKLKLANTSFYENILKYKKRVKITVILEYDYSKETDYKNEYENKL